MNTTPIMNQPLENKSMKPIEKSKRKQVKNACGKLIIFIIFFGIKFLTNSSSQLSKSMQKV